MRALTLPNPPPPEYLGAEQALPGESFVLARRKTVCHTRDEICNRMDAMAVQMEARGKLFESIQARPGTALDKAQTLLKLMVGGMLTEGVLANKARNLILGHLSQPGFLTSYMAAQAKDGEAPHSEKLMTELVETLVKAGINAETGLKSIAA